LFKNTVHVFFQVKIGKNNSRVIGLDGDMKNSTFSEKLRNVLPNQHIECFICEQNMAGVSSVFL
jgi:transketolase